MTKKLPNKDHRPVFKSNFNYCPDCGSEDTVLLLKGSTSVIWCHCGKVYVATNNTTKELFDFIGTTRCYFTKE